MSTIFEEGFYYILRILKSIDYSKIEIYSLITIAVIELILFLVRVYAKKKIVLKRLVLYPLIVYSHLILRLTFFGRDMGSADAEKSRFYFSWHDIFSKHGILNAGMFVPFGMLMFLLLRSYKNADRILLTFLFSSVFTLIIESLQLITASGRFEISDLVCNAAGGLLGGVIACVIQTAVQKEREAEKLQ